MKNIFIRPIALLFLMILLASCGTPPATSVPTETENQAEPTETVVVITNTDAPTSTPDPCSLPQLETEVQKVHKHMREFDDASLLASNMPREQLGTSIADLQRIRRESEDEKIPACLTNLKAIQVQHMNTVISTLLTFMRVSNPRDIDCVDVQENTEEQVVCQGLGGARQLHDDYTLELARVLGLTVVPATLPPSETPAP